MTDNSIYEALLAVAKYYNTQALLGYSPETAVDYVLRHPAMVEWASETVKGEDITTQTGTGGNGDWGEWENEDAPEPETDGKAVMGRIVPRRDAEDQRLREVALSLSVTGGSHVNFNGPVAQAQAYYEFLKEGTTS